ALLVSSGGVFVGGSTFNMDTFAQRFALLKYSPNGTLDTTFDADGLVTIDFGFGFNAIKSLALDSTGRIVAAGASGINGDSTDGDSITVARYNATTGAPA